MKISIPQPRTRNNGGADNLQLSPPLRDGEFWAVNDVSFELRRGEPGGDGAARTTAEGSPKGAMSGSERINASG
ncbi:MAG: hypothetical protein FGM15_10390 [Chthoniobacterales bacterium]|nr:hypothetical protein [Chthoniobacterales bacterium]